MTPFAGVGGPRRVAARPEHLLQKCQCENGQAEQCSAACGTCIAPACSEVAAAFSNACVSRTTATCARARAGRAPEARARAVRRVLAVARPERAERQAARLARRAAVERVQRDRVGAAARRRGQVARTTEPRGTQTGKPGSARCSHLTNQRRAQGATCGGAPYPPAGPLSMHPQLRQSARMHAQDMGQNNFFDYTNLQGQNPFDCMRAAGYQGRTMGENIAAGQSSPASVVQGWMNSPGHCQNIMQGAYKFIGVGYYNAPNSRYRHLWVQNFGG